MPNNLNKLRCYTAGPIEFADQLSEKQQAFNKEKLDNFLREKGVRVLDPKKIFFRGIAEIEDRKKLFDNKDYKEIRRQVKLIVRKDLRAVDISDFVIAYFPKGVKTTGTVHEIIEADRQRKPVLLLCPEGIRHIPLWFFGIIPVEYMFDSLKSLFEYLEKIDEYPEPDKLSDRWQFIISNLMEEETGI